MRTDIYMVRHAHSNYSSDELGRGVSQKGKNDLQLVTELLVGENVDVVISSPYRRAIETVEGVAQALCLHIVLEERFKERILSHEPVEDFHSALKKVWDNPEFAHKGGESNFEAAQRGIEGLMDILEKYKEKKIAIGTHGNIMAIIMNSLDKQYDYWFWRSLSMPDIYKLSFEEKNLVEVKRIWDRETIA